MSQLIALTATEIEQQLDESLEVVLSSRRTAAEIAQQLSGFERVQQDLALHWIRIVAASNALLRAEDAKSKLLVTLSDGKPDDFDQYRGRYGIEDTRQALIEARRAGIHVFCITIDQEAKDYLPHMYGAANFVVVDQVAKLPLKLSDVYRRLMR